MRVRLTAATLLAALLVATAAAEKVQVTGTVVDARSKALKDVTVGVRWTGNEKKLEAGHSAVTDKNGSFEIELDVADGKTVALVAMDKARRNMGYAEVSAGEKTRTVKISMNKTLNVNGTFDVSSLTTKPETVEMIVRSPDEYELLRIELPVKKRFAIKLAPGTYQIALACDGGDREARAVSVPEKKTTHDLGKLALRREKPKAEPAGENEGAVREGRPTPKLTVTDASGVAKSVKLSDYSGKWVLLEVWGVW